MTAEIIAVGTEILLGEIVDTNSAELARVLTSCGVFCYHRQVVGDNVARISTSVSLALSRSDIVFLIGGLGPTLDDVTREGIALAVGEDLIFDAGLNAEISSKLLSRGVRVVDSQSRQAMRLSDSVALSNPNGTAPGLLWSRGGKTVIAMPGPQLEFVPMLHEPVSSFLIRLGLARLLTRTIKIVGLGESLIEEKIGELMQSSDPSVAPYAKTGEVHLRIASHDSVVMATVEREIVSRLDVHIYGYDDDTIETVVLDRLRKRGETLAVAESCTGGGLGARLTSIAGSSDVFLGGVITYSNQLKMTLLGVSSVTLEKHGAVSEECAREMALGAREKTGATWGVSVTGIAGPGRGSEEKPVGLVFIGVAGPTGTTVSRYVFLGNREAVRERSVQATLTKLWNDTKDASVVQ